MDNVQGIATLDIVPTTGGVGAQVRDVDLRGIAGHVRCH